MCLAVDAPFDGDGTQQMQLEETSFAEFAGRLKVGNNDAAAQLLERYARRLRAIAVGRIGMKLRAKLDPDDVVQSVLASFFGNLQAGQYDLDSSRNLRGLLAIMVARKCARYAERYSAARRNIARECSLSNSASEPSAADRLADRRLLPDQAAMLADALEHCMSMFDSTDRQIIELILLGHSTEEIGLQVNCSQRTVQRTLQRFLRQLGNE